MMGAVWYYKYVIAFTTEQAMGIFTHVAGLFWQWMIFTHLRDSVVMCNELKISLWISIVFRQDVFFYWHLADCFIDFYPVEQCSQRS